MPTYLKYEYIFFSLFHFKVGSGVRSGFFLQLSRIRIHGKKCWLLIPEYSKYFQLPGSEDKDLFAVKLYSLLQSSAAKPHTLYVLHQSRLRQCCQMADSGLIQRIIFAPILFNWPQKEWEQNILNTFSSNPKIRPKEMYVSFKEEHGRMNGQVRKRTNK